MPSNAHNVELSQRFEPLADESSDRPLWPLLLMLAWLTFELTANATLSLVMACVNFGANDFRTAWWLWQTDPQRPRGRACAAFYAASGIWKTALVPLVVAGTISIVWALYSPHAMRPNHPVTVQLQKALFVGICAASLLVLLVALAAVCSLVARWRVWVHPNLHVSRRQQEWPPRFTPLVNTQDNHAKLIVMTAVFALVLIGPIVTLSLVSHLPVPRQIHTLLSLSVVFGFPIFAVVTLSFLRAKLFAESPWECWPESIRQLEATGHTTADNVGAEPENSA